MAIREKVLNPGVFAIEAARGILGSALGGLERYAEAAPILAEAATKMRQLGGQWNANQRRRTRDTVASLIQLYEATGRLEKAEEWKKSLASMPEPNPR
ncbi:MAG: hypothetical protein HY736_08330 [Verrucomicrobia bacterium]|nr:hypothetical protein [Verrucomicrobiota bacterium]